MTYCKNYESLTERFLRIAIIVTVVLSLIIPLMDPRVFAASSVDISGGDNVKGGDTFTVTVTFGGDDVGRVDGQLIYDTDKLTYLSGGSSSGNSGYIQLNEGGGDGSITFNIEFQAVTEGDTVLDITTNNLYDVNERAIDNVSGSKTISISGTAASEELITQTTSPEQPVEETELIGVDEKEDENTSTASISMILIIIAAVLVILIIIVAAILSKKKKNSKKKKYDDASGGGDEVGFREQDITAYGEPEKAEGYSDYPEWQNNREVKKRATEETKVWNFRIDKDNNNDDFR